MAVKQATLFALMLERCLKTQRAIKPRPVLAAGLLWLMPTLASADGSWTATAPPVRVFMADRDAASALLSPPTEIPTGSTIHEVIWRFETAPDVAVRGRLCHADQCIRVPAARGRSQGLAGLSADTSLRFRFALRPDQRPGGVVEGLQVIVNYQHPAP